MESINSSALYSSSDLPRPHPSGSPSRKIPAACDRSPGSWQIHTFFSHGVDVRKPFRYGLINFIQGEEIKKFGVLPVEADINFRQMLELMNLYEFRVKKLCTFVTNDLKEQEMDFGRDFPDAGPVPDVHRTDHISDYGTIVQLMSTALRNNYGTRSVVEILSSVLSPRGLVLISEDVLMDALKNKALIDGFVFVQPQAVNKKVVLDLLLSKGTSYFLMARSTSAEHVHDMVKLCIRASARMDITSIRSLGHSDFSMSPLNSPIKQIKSLRREANQLEIASSVDDVRIVLDMSPVDAGAEMMPHGFTQQPLSEKGGKLTSSTTLALAIFSIPVCVIILISLYGITVAPPSSSGFLFLEMIALCALLPAMLIIKIYLGIQTSERIIVSKYLS